jgi:hypothetical protein
LTEDLLQRSFRPECIGIEQVVFALSSQKARPQAGFLYLGSQTKVQYLCRWRSTPASARRSLRSRLQPDTVRNPD